MGSGIPNQQIIEFLSHTNVFNHLSPEILSDIMHRGVYLSGGGALVKGLAELIESEINVPVYISDDPLTTVARGTGIILENLARFKDVLIENESELPPKK